MSVPNWFEGLPVVGAMPPDRAAAKLSELGEGVAPPPADPDRPVFRGPLDFLPWKKKLWASTAHAFGYLPPAPPGSGPVPVVHAGDVRPDPSLKGARVRVTLDRLRVAQYPGGGTHRVLFDFYARNQADAGAEDLHFNATYRVKEGESAGVVGYPIFVGLRVGDEGLAFRCYTVNVRNDQDEALLGFLESDTFRAGLRLVGTAQPALGPLSALALNLTKAVAGRTRNVPVQDFYLGLDFGANPMGVRLAEGNYLAAQVPEDEARGWDWGKWAYDPRAGQVVGAGPQKEPLPFNYVVFGVSRYDGP
jgi:hypothetical protein